MKKLLSLILALVLLLPVFAGCTKTALPTASDVVTSSETVSRSDDVNASDITESDSEPVEAEPTKWFTFRPKVSSALVEEIYPESFFEAWSNLVDAVLAGEDSFECADQFTYNWMIFQFPDKYFPVFTQIFEPVYGADTVKDGIAHITYKVTKDEAAKMIEDFAELVEDIINATVRPDDSDFEKALALYSYFATTYTYDYETFEKMEFEYVNYTNTYRFMSSGVGICHEISAAYSYLLMQLGVDATIMMGPNHQWSYIRINGHNYHVDPTFALGEIVYLGYFMMTDEKRAETGFEPKDYVITGNYSKEFGCPEYVADDETFLPYWFAHLDSIDRDTKTLRCWDYNDDGEQECFEVDYSGFN